MPDQRPIDPNHAAPRTFFRLAGPLMLAAGAIFMIVGFVDFVHSMNSWDPPKLFWCFFVGMPLLFFGAVGTNLGYMGRMARYVAEEQTPVVTDAFNYAAQQTKGSVRDIAQAIGEGLRGGPASSPAEVRCPKCQHINEPGARFCSKCGAPVAQRRECPNCRHENDLAAHFCDNCGQALGT
jgi:hypothetical protein